MVPPEHQVLFFPHCAAPFMLQSLLPPTSAKAHPLALQLCSGSLSYYKVKSGKMKEKSSSYGWTTQPRGKKAQTQVLHWYQGTKVELVPNTFTSDSSPAVLPWYHHITLKACEENLFILSEYRWLRVLPHLTMNELRNAAEDASAPVQIYLTCGFGYNFCAY